MDPGAFGTGGRSERGAARFVGVRGFCDDLGSWIPTMRILFTYGLVPLLLIGTVVACSASDGNETGDESPEEAAEEAELALHMARLQRWTHKTTLALQARNPELAEFYLHETEESIETIQSEAPTYEGHAISTLTDEMLVPSVEALDGALDDREWAAVDARLDDLAESCNQCHAATDHGFVKIDLDDVPNPFTQDFSTSTR